MISEFNLRPFFLFLLPWLSSFGSGLLVYGDLLFVVGLLPSKFFSAFLDILVVINGHIESFICETVVVNERDSHVCSQTRYLLVVHLRFTDYFLNVDMFEFVEYIHRRLFYFFFTLYRLGGIRNWRLIENFMGDSLVGL